eukprot:TRINITY_DN4203_c0_g1_i2.p1 TRINITY_DN4203_c0_g1~~TRINITY_DN4203_c0_g1_i2.p1  ORF type:complete len:107 (+),score=61.87 TRINITY_DN4203_c0_g1_i2:34-354(+)
MSASVLVENAIKANIVTIFSKSYCPYCVRAKELFTKLAVPFFAMELDKIPEGDSIQQELKKRTGGSSVPRVFINGEFIGGCDDTVALHSKGGLVKKLEAAGLNPKH